MSESVSVNFQALQQAAEWFAVLQADSLSQQEQQAWQAWLDASPQHQVAWQQVSAVSLQCEQLRGLETDRQALGSTLRQTSKQRLQRRRILGMLLGVGVLGWATWRYTPAIRWTRMYAADYRTATGERRQIALSDGTQLWLNTATAVNLHYNAMQRRLSLVSGEILIETASDPRPFSVQTDYGILQALGTRFNVRLHDDAASLAVYAGAVEIQQAQQSKIVEQGWQTRLDSDGITALQPVSAAEALWTRGRLVVNDMRLAEFVAELQRYRHGVIHLQDDIADLRMVGTFPLDDTDRALAMLEQILPVTVQQPLPWWVMVGAR